MQQKTAACFNQRSLYAAKAIGKMAAEAHSEDRSR
jgi:hypothetical protein